MIEERSVFGHPAARRVLVVGVGFIGTHVAKAIQGAGIAVTLLSRSPVPAFHRSSCPAPLFRGDASDPALVAAALDGVGHVVYCAGGLMPAQSDLHPAADVELTLPPLISVLEALRRRPGVGITFLSSGGTVYGPARRLPVDESHPTNPISSYGILKLAGEKYVRMYERLHEVPGCILRCSNVYGEGQPPDRGQGVVAAFLHRALTDEPVVVFGDGSVVRDYLYVGDLAALVVDLLLSERRPRLANVGSGVGTSINEVAAVVGDVTGKALRVERRPSRPFDVEQIVLDASHVRGFVRFEPMPLEAGVRRTWDALRSEVPLGTA